MTRTFDIPILGLPVACSIPWCLGLRWEHGGDDAEADTWMHRGSMDDLRGAAVARVRYGSGPDRWAVFVDAIEVEVSSPSDTAHELRRIAAALEATEVRS